MTNELARSCRMMLIISGCIFTFLIILWFLTPVKPLVAGIILGGLISIYNIFHMAFRVKLASDRVIAGSQKLVGIKTLSRILMVVFGIILAYRFPEWIDYRSMVLTLPLGYILMVIVVSFTYISKPNSHQEGRDVLGTDSEAKVPRHDV